MSAHKSGEADHLSTETPPTVPAQTTTATNNTMTASTCNTTPAAWIENTSDASTVISELTHDHTYRTTGTEALEALTQRLSCLREDLQASKTVTPTTESDDGSTPLQLPSLLLATPNSVVNIKPVFNNNPTAKEIPVITPSTTTIPTTTKNNSNNMAMGDLSMLSKQLRFDQGSTPFTTPPSTPGRKVLDDGCHANQPSNTTATQDNTASPSTPVKAKTKKSATATRNTSPRSKKQQLKAAPKTNSKVAPKPAPTSPFSGGQGLSELSKQLRVLRAKNEFQHNEIDRLERQLRILSDLKGVSVSDLRFGLERACQEEAHDELRNQVLSLQAQLEAIQAQRETSRRRASTADMEATNQKMATLQLRIGELEEVDQAKRGEIQSLYQKLQEQTARSTTLEAANTQQQAQMAKFEQVAQTYIQDVQSMKQERDGLQETVAKLTRQLQQTQGQLKIEQEMRELEHQIQMEQQKKEAFLQQARAKRLAKRSNQLAGSVADADRESKEVAVNKRLSVSQLAAIQGVVQRQACPNISAPVDLVATDKESFAPGGRGLEGTGNSSDTESLTSATNHDSTNFDDNASVTSCGRDSVAFATGEELRAKDVKIETLYKELRQQAARATQLETLCANQKAELNKFIEQLNEKQDILKSTQSNYDFAKNEHDSLYTRFCDIELQLNLEQQKAQNLEYQLHSRVKESDLRKNQFDCRFKVQNERIFDLEQQQQSLYKAFELLQQEVKAQDSEQAKLKSSLDSADMEVARRLQNEQKQKAGQSTPSPPSSPTRNTTLRSLVPYRASSSPALMGQHGHQAQDAETKMAGYLWKLDKIKGWKRRYFVLYGNNNGVYHMTYSDGPRQKIKGTIDCITTGVSTVAETNKSAKKPFSFALHVDPLDHHATVLYAAAMNLEEFTQWMAALNEATIRPEDNRYLSQPTLSAEAQEEADRAMALQMSGSAHGDLSLVPFNLDANSRTHAQGYNNYSLSDLPTSNRMDNNMTNNQVEEDHLMAVRMSIQNGPTAFA